LMIRNCVESVKVTNESHGREYILSLPNPKLMTGWMLKQAIFDRDGIFPSNQMLVLASSKAEVLNESFLATYFGTDEIVHFIVAEKQGEKKLSGSKKTFFHFFTTEVFNALVAESTGYNNSERKELEPGMILLELPHNLYDSLFS